MAQLEKKPAHELILQEIRNAVGNCVFAFENGRKNDYFAQTHYASGSINALLDVLEKMTIPEAARTDILEQLRQIYESSNSGKVPIFAVVHIKSAIANLSS